MKCGKFVISLDFELIWGVRDKRTIQSYGENLRGVHQAIPRLLNLFDQYKIKGTFATVGFLFFETKAELLANTPKKIPAYTNVELSPYEGHFNLLGENYKEDVYHFAPQLINEIKKHPEQEISTHTFSHYYCLENGQTQEDFKADLDAALQIAEKKGITITSIVFPRNQFNEEYIKIIKELGLISYRGNENCWLYKAKKGEQESSFRRALRLIDAYFNISGHNCYSDDFLISKFPMDIPSSRFLRPYSKSLKTLEGFRLRRILSGMTFAAKHNQTYHLWWHPHNFGTNQNENFSFLEKILEHYQFLNHNYGFKSITMSQLSLDLNNKTHG